MAKQKAQKSLEQLLSETLIPPDEIPYEIPKNWCWSNLKNLVGHQAGNSKLIKGKLFPQPNKGLFPAYSASGQDVFCEGYEHEGEAIVVSAVGARCGKAFLAKGEWSAIANTHIIFPSKALDLYYLFYLVNNESWWVKSGSAQPFIVVNESLERPFPLPPLEEQRRIVEKIKDLFIKLNEARRLILKAFNAFEECKSALLYQAFCGDLTKKQRRKQKKRPDREWTEKLSGIDFATNGIGWITMKAEDACGAKITCGHTPTQKICKDGEIPFLKVYNIVNNRIDFEYKPQYIDSETSKKLNSSALEPNDVVMNIVGPPLGKIAIIPDTFPKWNMNQAIVRFRVKEFILPKFLFYELLYPKTLKDVIRKTKGVVGQANISVTQSRNLKLVIPPLSEQEEIVRVLDRFFGRDEKIKALLCLLDKIEEMKKSILARAFRGQLGTNDPDDESAAELLKRVLAEQQTDVPEELA